MKTRIFFLLMLVPLLAFCFGNCKNSDDSEDSDYCILYYNTTHGSAPSPKAVAKGYKITQEDLPDMYDDSNEFCGWNIAVNTIITSSTNISAVWIPLGSGSTQNEKCLISYSSTYGTVPQRNLVSSGYVLKSSDLPVLSKTGYCFEGWDKSAGGAITTDTTLTAGWSAYDASAEDTDCTISYSSAKGTAPTGKTVKYGYVLTAADLAPLSQTGYYFRGWDKSAGGVITGNTTLTASWEAKKFRISYESAHGTAPAPKIVDYDYQLASSDLPTLTETGYTFVGWDKSSGDSITKNTTIKASWKINTYTITYVSAQGTPPASKTVEHGYKLTAADLPELSETGWTFGGWDTAVDTEVTGNITITAAWSAV